MIWSKHMLLPIARCLMAFNWHFSQCIFVQNQHLPSDLFSFHWMIPIQGHEYVMYKYVWTYEHKRRNTNVNMACSAYCSVSCFGDKFMRIAIPDDGTTCKPNLWWKCKLEMQTTFARVLQLMMSKHCPLPNELLPWGWSTDPVFTN